MRSIETDSVFDGHRNLNVELKFTDSEDENIYRKIDRVSVTDEKGRKFLAKPALLSYENRNNLTVVKVESVPEDAKLLNFSGTISQINRTLSKNKTSLDYQKVKPNTIIYENGGIKVYLLNLNDLKSLKKNNPSEFKNRLNFFHENQIFGNAQNPPSFSDIIRIFDEMQLEKEDIVLFVIDKSGRFVRVNFVNNDEIANFGYSVFPNEGGNGEFLVLSHFPDGKSKDAKLEILTNENSESLNFDLKNVEIKEFE